MQQYDVHLAHSMENGMNYPAVVFAMQLVQRFCTDIDRLTVRAQEVCRVHLNVLFRQQGALKTTRIL